MACLQGHIIDMLFLRLRHLSILFTCILLSACGGGEGGGGESTPSPQATTSPYLASVQSASDVVDVQGMRLQVEALYTPPAAIPTSAYLPSAANSTFCTGCAASVAIPKSSQPGSFLYFTTSTPGVSISAIAIKKIVMVTAGHVEEIPIIGSTSGALIPIGNAAMMNIPNGINPDRLAVEIVSPQSGSSLWLSAKLKPIYGTYRVYGQNGFGGYTSSSYYQQTLRAEYDWSGGSSALASALQKFGAPVQEKDAMEGMMTYGEQAKIVERRGFSLLDMKRYLEALGITGNGYGATIDDFRDLFPQTNSAAIIPVDILGIKHFVLLNGVDQQYVYISSSKFGSIAIPMDNINIIQGDKLSMTVFIITVPDNWRMPK